jgi:hypothetical protein
MPGRGLHHSNHHPKEHGTGHDHHFGYVSMSLLDPPPDRPNPPAPDPAPPTSELALDDAFYPS